MMVFFIKFCCFLISVSLLSGLLYWGVNLRDDLKSEIIFIARPHGLARIMPDDPGGLVVEFQGLAINRLQAGHNSALPNQQIVFAPQSFDLTDEDLSKAQLLHIRTNNKFTVPAELNEIKMISAVNGIRQQLSNSELKLKTVSTSHKMVQLGAFNSFAIAQNEWLRISERHSDLLRHKKHVIQEIQSDGRHFFRLRIFGFADGNAARSMCSALRARLQACLTITVR